MSTEECTPTWEDVVKRWSLHAPDGATRKKWDAELLAWFDASLATERGRIAQLIWDEEQYAASVYARGLTLGRSPGDSTLVHLNGRALGLLRARDIATHGSRNVADYR